MSHAAHNARTDDRISKLPNWAQDLIDNLRQRTFEAESRLAEQLAGNPDSNCGYFNYSRSTDQVRTPRGSTFRIEIGPRWEDGRAKHFVEIREEDGAVQLMTSSSAILFGKSSNCFLIDVEDRYEKHEDAHVRNLGHRLIDRANQLGLSFNDLHELMDGAPETAEEIRMLGIRGRARRAEKK